MPILGVLLQSLNLVTRKKCLFNQINSPILGIMVQMIFVLIIVGVTQLNAGYIKGFVDKL